MGKARSSERERESESEICMIFPTVQRQIETRETDRRDVARAQLANKSSETGNGWKGRVGSGQRSSTKDST